MTTTDPLFSATSGFPTFLASMIYGVHLCHAEKPIQHIRFLRHDGKWFDFDYTNYPAYVLRRVRDDEREREGEDEV